MGRALMPDLVIGGERVPRAAIAAEAQHHPAPRGKPVVAWKGAVGAMTVRTLLLQEARRRGIVPDPAILGPDRREADDEALVRGLLEAAVVAEPPTESAVRAEWARDPGRFRSPPLWDVSHILVAHGEDTPAGWEAAQRHAADLLKQAASRPSGFARLAAESSACSSAANGGSLGQVRPGDTAPEFEAALRSLDRGQLAPAPVRTRFGWHVIRVNEVAGGDVLPFDAVRPRLAEAMEKTAWARAAKAFVAELATAAGVPVPGTADAG